MKNKPLLKALQLVLVLCLLLPLSFAASVHAENTLLLQTGFEDGTVQNWVGRGGVEILATAPEAAHEGAAGLSVSGRTKTWHGPSLDITSHLQIGQTYEFIGWVKLPAGASNTSVYMSLQRTLPAATYYENLTSAAVTSGSWVKLAAKFKMLEAADQISVYFEVPGSATASFYLDDFRLEQQPDAGPIVIEPDIPSLKDVFADDFLIGTAFTNNELLTEPDRQLMIKHFNSVTPGNVLKWDATEPQEGQFTFAGSDAAVQFAADNGQEVRGHTLVWHNQTPNWVFYDANGNLASKELLYERMRNHIQTVMTRYKGEISAWDVANEVIDTSQPDGLRRSLWYQIAGEEYIEKAFEFAHEADPDAKLFINDYNTHETAKAQALYNLIQRLQAKGVPIDGVGHQTHVSLYYPTIAEIENSIVKFQALGLETHITELDVSVYSDNSQSYETFPETLKTRQATLYKQLFEVFKRHSDTVTSVTLWGKDDGNTWLRTYPVVRNNWPLLFDERLQSKPAYWSVIETTQAPAIPAAPTGLSIAPGDGYISLSWSASGGATSYTVKRASSSGGPYTAIATLSGLSYTDSSVTVGVPYYYVVSAANSAGSSADSTPVTATALPGTPGNLALQYRAADTNATDAQIKPFFKIKNNGTAPVPASSLKLRYWFTIDGNKPLSFFCDYASLGNASVTGSFVKLDTPRVGADYYLEVSFSAAAGNIPAGGDSGEIQTRFSKTDWSSFNETNDYSFDPAKTSFVNWSKVTLYQNGELVWGTEP